MESNPEPFGLKIHGYMSDAEIQSNRQVILSKGATKQYNTDDNEENEEEMIYPESILKVEVNEGDEVISPPNFSERPKRKKRPLPALLPVVKKSARLVSPGTKKSARLQNKEKQAASKTEVEFVDVSCSEPKLQDDEDKGMRCKICKKRFKKRKILKRHVLTHEGNCICPICDISFRNNIILGRHVASTHNKTEKCDKCPEIFHTKRQLKLHLRKNHKNKGDNNSDSSWREELETITICRSDVSFDIQTAIVSKMHKAVPVREICRLYNVTPEVVSEIWNDREKFILPNRVMRRTVSYINRIIEPLILEWYNEEKSKDTQLTGRMIQNIAEKIAKEKGFVHFNASPKWLERFKRRHDIYLTNLRRENPQLSTESVWKKKFFEGRWQKIRLEYTDNEIYAADEVGFFYNSSKSRERKFAGKKFVQGEREDRLSIFLCANMSGTDKRRMLVCGTEDPLINSNGIPSTLPVDYKRHSQCHFTTDMFEEYVQKWNEALKKNNEKALVLLDRASIHTKLELSNLQLEFLPWKSQNSLMPIRSGVFATLRAEFRNLLLQFKCMNVIKEQDRNLTCLEALEMLQKAWNRLPRNVITKSFLDLGFEVQKLEIDSTEILDTDKDSDKLCEFLKDYDVEPYFMDRNDLDMYLTVDEDVLVGKGTKANVFGGNHKVKEESTLVNVDVGVDLPLNTGQPISEEMELLIRGTRNSVDLYLVKQKLQTYDASVRTYFKFLDEN